MSSEKQRGADRLPLKPTVMIQLRLVAASIKSVGNGIFVTGRLRLSREIQEASKTH
jgi:hypothetical protein